MEAGEASALPSVGSMTILLSDDRVRAVPVVESGEPLVRLPLDLSPAGALVRAGLADRLVAADALLPPGRPAPGRRGLPPARRSSSAIIAAYAAAGARPPPGRRRRGARAADQPVRRTRSRRSARRRRRGRPDPGRRLRRRARPGHARSTRRPRTATAAATSRPAASAPTPAPTATSSPRCWRSQGLVNYPTEWWHWSFGDRYWALLSGARHALYGPLVRGGGGVTRPGRSPRRDRTSSRPAPGHRPRRRRAQHPAARRPGEPVS